MLKYSRVALLAAAMLVVGCGAQKGSTIMTLGKGDTPQPLATVKEGREGTYAIYPNTGLNAIRSDVLQEGDQYGFTREDDKTYGVLGEDRIPLESTLSTGYIIKYQGTGK